MPEVTFTTVSLAVIASLQILALTIVQAVISSRKEKRDYARQDEVAERVVGAAKIAANAAEVVARKAEESGQLLQDKLTAIDEQGKKIHILVNSDMTAARTAERDSLKLLVIALRRIGTVTGSDGESEKKEILEVEKRIKELNQILADRNAAQQKVEQETLKESNKIV